jgi:hypothetical protein
MNSAPPPDVNGEPVTGESVPLLPTRKAETVPDPELLTKAKLVLWAGGGTALLMELQPDKPGTRMAKTRIAKTRFAKTRFAKTRFGKPSVERGITGEIIQTIFRA